jgi:hypothetical protein
MSIDQFKWRIKYPAQGGEVIGGWAKIGWSVAFFVAAEKCMMIESNYCFSYKFFLQMQKIFPFPAGCR